MSYSAFDQERFLDEPAKRAGRTEFMRDRARVIHSIFKWVGTDAERLDAAAPAWSVERYRPGLAV